MFGWLSRAAAWASARSRRRKAGSVLVDGGRTLTATCRPRTSSNPRHTTDIPPAPSRSTSRYLPANRLDPGRSVVLMCPHMRDPKKRRVTPPCHPTPGLGRPAMARTFPLDGEDVSPPRRLSRDAGTGLYLRIVTDGFPAYADCRCGPAEGKVGSRTHFRAALPEINGYTYTRDIGR